MDAYLRNLRAKLGTDLIKAPGAGVIARNDDGHVLLVRRSDNGMWGLAGGWVSPGEGVQDTAVREAFEETGYEVEIARLLGVYSQPHLTRWTYPNGDQAEFVNLIFEGRVLERSGGLDDETLEVRFFSADEVRAMLQSVQQVDRQPLLDALSDDVRPFVR